MKKQLQIMGKFSLFTRTPVLEPPKNIKFITALHIWRFRLPLFQAACLKVTRSNQVVRLEFFKIHVSFRYDSFQFELLIEPTPSFKIVLKNKFSNQNIHNINTLFLAFKQFIFLLLEIETWKIKHMKKSYLLEINA